MSGARILLVDDHPVVRAGCVKLLEAREDFQIVGEADTTTAAFRGYRRLEPDIVIMDLARTGSSGLEAIRLIRAFDRNARILVFSMRQGAPFALKAFEAGAAGFVTKTSPPEELIRALAVMLKGGRAVSDDIAREIAAERLSGRRSPLEDLGPREVEILHLIASGMTTATIAGALALSRKTVQNYHSAIKAKLGAETDASLVWIAIDAGLMQPTAVGIGPPSQFSSGDQAGSEA